MMMTSMVSVGRAEGQNGLFSQFSSLVALLRAADVLAVLQVVADHQVRTMRAVSKVAHPLCRSRRPDLASFAVTMVPDLPDAPHAGALGKSMARRGLNSSSALIASNIVAARLKASMMIRGNASRPVSTHQITNIWLTRVDLALPRGAAMASCWPSGWSTPARANRL